MSSIDDWNKQRAYVYLRRSPGEKGSTADQLERIKPLLMRLEKEGKIAPINWNIVGKDIAGKRRFKASRDLAVEGDIFNEGEGASGFDVEERPVLKEMLSRMEQPKGADAALGESMDRFARDILSLASIGLPLWRGGGKIFWSLSENRGLGTEDPYDEPIIITSMTWGGVGKKEEARKAKAALRSKWDEGFIMGSRPEWLGSGTKSAGIDYRKAWKLMQAYGENAKGNLKGATAVAFEMGKKKKDGGGENKWASLWYRKMRDWNELGVLDDWLDGVEAVNQFILNQGVKPRWSYKQEGATNLRNSTRGFFAYPAGVQPGGSDVFVTFPNPLDIGIQELADNPNPNDIEGWEVTVEPVGSRVLAPAQTQRGKA